MRISPAPKISIVTCFLNVENYIEETILSVLQQEHDNWELLLIDDGSTDNSTSIAKLYAKRYPSKIFYTDHEGHQNKGASYSRNVAIERATGEYIAFLDADDVWLPVYLKHQLKVLQAHHATMVCEATEYWHNWTRVGKQNVLTQVGTQQNKLFTPPQLLLDLYPLGRGAAPCICGMLVKREAVLRHGGFDDSFKGMYDDQALLIKLYLNDPIYISSTANNRYRQRPESLVHTSHQTGNYHSERKAFLEWLETHLQSQKVKYTQVEKLLGAALMPYRFPLLYFMTRAVPQKAKRMMRSVVPASVKQFVKKAVWV
ncbi:glycosyltransferase family 2 protein [Pontibacter anaerobius]|uniref:Glycosyltransferase family A protein n=1 Tax=Pontibacter anaerobius TaxID=2993940 RepID=A0ABT3RF34_9BACT|nr:glycosyltransferase family A protein [Pontibacter anaerobius]MCX2740008.1 glycosyltransferase family A protein [Pontibacter anaerobius]